MSQDNFSPYWGGPISTCPYITSPKWLLPVTHFQCYEHLCSSGPMVRQFQALNQHENICIHYSTPLLVQACQTSDKSSIPIIHTTPLFCSLWQKSTEVLRSKILPVQVVLVLSIVLLSIWKCFLPQIQKVPARLKEWH